MKKRYCVMLSILLYSLILAACGMVDEGADSGEASEQHDYRQAISLDGDADNFEEDTTSEDVLNEETDDKERVVTTDRSDRWFVIIRGLDMLWASQQINQMNYFGALKEAYYEIPLSEEGSVLDIHFSLSLELGEEKIYRTDLWNGRCTTEEYDMTVTEQGSGRVLQESTVKLCIERHDTILFKDLNGDGYVDMQINMPVHNNGFMPTIEEWSPPSYMLWNQAKEQFEQKTERELENSILAVRNGLTEEEQKEQSMRERRDYFAPLTQLPRWANPDSYIELTKEGWDYVVQPGDSLWGISEHFLGSGFSWTALQRKEDGADDPDLLLPGEIVHIPGEVLYIHRDVYSSGGLSSPGRYQIDEPSGFEYSFLVTDVTPRINSELNQIYLRPLANEIGENALSEDWETFQAEVIRCSEEICADRVSELRFEKYEVKGGCDLYGYSFEYDTGDAILEYTCFIRLGEANMVEVIGVRKKEPNTVLLNTIRYIAASFVDYGGVIDNVTIGDGKTPNVGAEDWAYPWLHNLFRSAQNMYGEKGQ